MGTKAGAVGDARNAVRGDSRPVAGDTVADRFSIGHRLAEYRLVRAGHRLNDVLALGDLVCRLLLEKKNTHIENVAFPLWHLLPNRLNLTHERRRRRPRRGCAKTE